MKQRELITSGPINRAVLRLAIPPVLGMFMVFARGVTDFFWVGKLGATAQDAVTTSMVMLWTVFSYVSIISVGITALVSRHVGAKELDKVRFYIRQAYAMAVLVSIAIAVCGYFAAPVLLDFMDASEATSALALPYLRVFFLSGFLWTLEETSYAIFRSSGDTRTPMIVGSIGVIINMILDPFLIFGLGPFPELGVMGASVATSFSALVAVVIILVLMKKGKPDRAESCAWRATGLAVAVTFVVGFFFLVLPGLIVGIFTSDPAVAVIAKDYLIILGISQAAMAVEMVLEGSFVGAGNTLPPMLVLVPFSLLRVPLAYYLAFNLEWGINGVWWTLTITSFIKAVILTIWFRRGNWKKTQL